MMERGKSFQGIFFACSSSKSSIRATCITHINVLPSTLHRLRLAMTAGHVSSGGTNAGASMSVRQRRPRHRCCVSIYLNNNTQGVTNSVLFRSRVAMGDAGARLSFRRREDDDRLLREIRKLVMLQRLLLLLILSLCLLGLTFCFVSRAFRQVEFALRSHAGERDIGR